MPEHRFAKDQPEWHFVYQCFKGAGMCVAAGKVRVGPSPEVAMPVSAVVSLHSEPQRIARKAPAIKHDLAGKKRVGMRGSRESNPALVAQRDPKCGTTVQVPRNCVPRNLHFSSARVLADFMVADLEVERTLPAGAELQTLQRKFLREALRFSIPRKPRGPHLDGHPTRVACATAPAGIHQQISEPPRPAAVRQSQTNKPDFVAAPGRKR